jgi:hypothetical protein
MLYKLAVISAIAITSADAHIHPSSLLQLGDQARNTVENVNADEVIASIQKQVSDFQKKMNDVLI